MLKFLAKKQKQLIIATFILAFIISGAGLFNLAKTSLAQGMCTSSDSNECTPTDGPQHDGYRCSGDIMQICKNGDDDPYLEWRDYIDCSDYGVNCDSATGKCENSSIGFCGDGSCDQDTECSFCGADCSPANCCGNNHCDNNIGEDVNNCPGDCAYCEDNDNDGYGVCPNCGTTNGCAHNGDDCNDDPNNGGAYCYPGNPSGETCDTHDNDCNGATDEGCDDDHDGYCDNTMAIYNNTSICPNTIFTGNGMHGDDCEDRPNGADGTAGNADDGANIHPGTETNCSDNIDNDCDGNTDCDDHPDCDSDPNCCTPTCSTGPGCRTSALNNAHTTSDICCGAGEACYACNAGYTWNGSACVSASSCTDDDSDGHYAIDPVNCPSGDDCNDNNENIYPGAPEICDGLDDDCNPATTDENICDQDHDDYCSCVQVFAFGSDLSAVCAHTNTTDANSIANTCDCDDTDAAVNPGVASETNCSDGIDNDCDGNTDCVSGHEDPDCNCSGSCTPDGCNGNCPSGCTGNDDPDCNGACLDCTCSTDTDCSSTCAAGDGCCAGCSPADPDCGGSSTCTFPATLPCTFP